MLSELLLCGLLIGVMSLVNPTFLRGARDAFSCVSGEWGSVSCLDMGLAGGLERAVTGVCQLIHFRAECWCHVLSWQPGHYPSCGWPPLFPPHHPTAPPGVDRLRVLALQPARYMHSAE